MFTGIVETTGRIEETRASASGRRLRVAVASMARECHVGDSICVDGVCLTVADVAGDGVEFDVIPETLRRSGLGQKGVGAFVNLERSLRVGDRLDGHIVQGHVDGLATVTDIVRSSNEHVVWLRPAASLRPFIIPKGSVSLDGVSLTIADLRDGDFSVALIPLTLERTTLGGLRRGDAVNVETDIIVRTVVHHLQQLSVTPDWARLPLESAGPA